MLSSAYAQAAGPAGGGESLFSFLFPLLLIFGVFYFLLIRPQQKKEKERRAKVAALKIGDWVLFGGGVYGRVAKLIDEHRVKIDIADQVHVQILRNAVTQVLEEDPSGSGKSPGRLSGKASGKASGKGHGKASGKASDRASDKASGSDKPKEPPPDADPGPADPEPSQKGKGGDAQNDEPHDNARDHTPDDTRDHTPDDAPDDAPEKVSKSERRALGFWSGGLAGGKTRAYRTPRAAWFKRAGGIGRTGGTGVAARLSGTCLSANHPTPQPRR